MYLLEHSMKLTIIHVCTLVSNLAVSVSTHSMDNTQRKLIAWSLVMLHVMWYCWLYNSQHNYGFMCWLYKLVHTSSLLHGGRGTLQWLCFLLKWILHLTFHANRSLYCISHSKHLGLLPYYIRCQVVFVTQIRLKSSAGGIPQPPRFLLSRVKMSVCGPCNCD